MRDLSYQCIYISEKSISCRNGIRSVVYTYFALDVWGGKGAICEDITAFTVLLSVLFASAPSGSLILQLTGIRDYPAMLSVIHGTVAVVSLCGIIVMGRELYQKSGIFKKQEYALVILFLLSMGVEMIRF